jgi:hypothetical protein
VWHVRGGANARGFPVFLKDTSWSSPAVADIDRDGWLDIVVGYDCDGVRGQPCHPARGGYLTAIRHDGRVKAGWPRLIRDQVVWSSPALVDLTGDGKLDVVVGTGNMPMAGGRSVYAFRSDGRLLWRRDVGGRTMSSPAVGDLTGDGRAEVAIVAEDGKLYVLHGNGTVRYAKCIANSPTACANKRLHASPSIADVDGDGRQEVVVGGEQWLNVFDGHGRFEARGQTYAGSYPLTAAPTVAAVGGTAWLVAVSGTGSAGRVFAWTTGKPLGPAAWPTFRQSTRRSGWIPR